MSWMTTNKWARWTIKMRELLTANKEEIIQKIDAIPAPDLSSVAKQGNNPDVSLSSMDDKLGNVVMMTDDERPYALADLLSKIV